MTLSVSTHILKLLINAFSASNSCPRRTDLIQIPPRLKTESFSKEENARFPLEAT